MANGAGAGGGEIQSPDRPAGTARRPDRRPRTSACGQAWPWAAVCASAGPGRPRVGVAAGSAEEQAAASSMRAGTKPGRIIDRGRGASDQESAVAVEGFPVDPDLRVVAHVAQHVPVDGRAVVTAGIGVAGAERQVNRAPDLLIEQDVARQMLQGGIGPDTELAQVARSGIGVAASLRDSPDSSPPTSAPPGRPRRSVRRLRPRGPYTPAGT